MSKCCVCDERGAGMYYAPSDDMYHQECWARLYRPLDYQQGYDMAKAEIKDGSIEPVAALLSFENDPPENARHYGYMDACAEAVEEMEGN